jgi:hypothetical protein
LKQQGRDWFTFPKAAPSAPHYFAETGHAIAHGPFWQYWSTHGLQDLALNPFGRSLALFGMPLSEPAMETNSSGDTVLTQWFERARFEDHGANGVLLGLLGNETRTQPAPAPAPSPSPSPAPVPDACAGIAAPVDAYIEPNCVRFGDEFYVEAGGFDPNSQVGFWITDESGFTVGSAQTIRTDEDGIVGGTIDTRDYFGYELRPGNYVFVVQDAAHKYRPSTAPFRVIPANGPSPSPSPSPSPRPSPPPPAPNCDPSYPTVCIPSPPPDLDCPDIPHRNFPVRPPDPHRFDGDNDGIGCETP